MKTAISLIGLTLTSIMSEFDQELVIIANPIQILKLIMQFLQSKIDILTILIGLEK